MEWVGVGDPTLKRGLFVAMLVCVRLRRPVDCGGDGDEVGVGNPTLKRGLFVVMLVCVRLRLCDVVVRWGVEEFCS